VHSVQVEINRALYLDEKLVQTSSAAAELASDLDRLTQTLVAAVPSA